MDWLWRWMAKNRLLAKIIFGVFLCAAYSWLLHRLNVPVWIIVLVDLFLLFVNHAFVDVSGTRLMKKPLKILENYCDPYPLLQEMQTQLGYPYVKTAKQTIQIDYAMALRSTGEIQKSWELLDSIHIDQYPGTLPFMKVVYYNNLADVLTLLERYEEAELWGRKALQLYRDLPEGRMKRKFSPTMQTLRAESHYRRGEYAQALQCLESIPQSTLRNQVELALLHGQCALALGDREKAAEKLRFAAEKGYKLYTATRAKQLLAKIGGHL